MRKIKLYKINILTLLCLAGLALSACGTLEPASAGGSETKAPDQPGNVASTVSNATLASTIQATRMLSPTTLPSLTVDQLKNTTYQAKDFADLASGVDQVTLVDGTFSKTDLAVSTDHPVFTIKYLQSATGDLNGDGAPDAVVILVADTGGSGAFEYLAAVANLSGKPQNVDTISLADRTQIDSLTIIDGSVDLQMVVHGPQDPMCCPTLKTSETYLLNNGHLMTQAEKTAAPLAQGVIQALKNKDMAKLASFVHPTAGVRFSAYANVKETDLVFTPDQLTTVLTDQTSYLWGSFDGSGAPIQLTFTDYFAKFVYSQDFAGATQVSYNHPLSSGNTIDNSRDFYPNAVVVEYYLPGTDPSLGGMDWQSLRLVFQAVGTDSKGGNGQWYLVGIIHSQWTI